MSKSYGKALRIGEEFGMPLQSETPRRRAHPGVPTVRSTVITLVLLVAAGLLVAPAPPTAAEDPPHVLVWSGTYGYRHPSISDGNQIIQDLADETGAFTVEFTENPLDLTAETLAGVDVLLWNNTTGKPPFSPEQREDIIRFAACGGGNVGLHAAADANYAWSGHAELWGAQFDSHPQGAGDPAVRLVNEQPSHPVVAGWDGADSFELADELYRWRADTGLRGMSLPRNLPDTEVLLSLDETTVSEDIQSSVTPYQPRQPIAWVRTFRDGGRVYYNNMGHGDASWQLPAFQQSLVDGILWTSGVALDAECLFGGSELPARQGPPVPDPDEPVEQCPVPEVPVRAGPNWQISGEAERLTEDGDSMTMPGVGVPGGLGWSAQTYVLDLSATGAHTADIMFDLTWPVPADDYDLSVTLPWGWAGSQELLGPERLGIEDVPHCTVFKVFAENVVAVSQQAPTLTAAVERQPSPAPGQESVRPVSNP